MSFVWSFDTSGIMVRAIVFRQVMVRVLLTLLLQALFQFIRMRFSDLHRSEKFQFKVLPVPEL